MTSAQATMSPATHLRRLTSSAADFDTQLQELLAFETDTDASIEQSVAAILDHVRRDGDAAVLEYTRRYDHLTARTLGELELGKDQLQEALRKLPANQRAALEQAATRIQNFHQRQKALSWNYEDSSTGMAGTRLGQQVTPLDRVGLYVPGGKASYPSSVLMNAIPAKVAGVPELVMVSPTPRGEQNPLVLAAAALAGVDRVFAIGGAQAVAALAYGTATIPQVDKIVGPGNAYVAAAKRRVFGVVGIDMVAGPSEILIIADASANPDWVAMDMFAQAEHDELAQAILLSPDATLLDRVAASIARLLPEMPRREVIQTSLAKRGALILTRDLTEAAAIANRIAPEHLELAVAEPRQLAEQIRHAGAIFLGHYTSESLGDYCAGPNHVLPTSRSARFSSPLGVYDFQKRSSVIEISVSGARSLGPIAATLAQGEGLSAHARAAELRLQEATAMPLIEWQEAYNIGIEEIDRQHQHLVSLINRLTTYADKTQIASTYSLFLAEMFDYAQNHFKDEEALMERLQHPDLAMHRRQHADFFEHIASLSQVAQPGLPELRSLHQFLHDWLIDHILRTDMSLRQDQPDDC